MLHRLLLSWKISTFSREKKRRGEEKIIYHNFPSRRDLTLLWLYSKSSIWIHFNRGNIFTYLTCKYWPRTFLTREQIICIHRLLQLTVSRFCLFKTCICLAWLRVNLHYSITILPLSCSHCNLSVLLVHHYFNFGQTLPPILFILPNPTPKTLPHPLAPTHCLCHCLSALMVIITTE